MGEEGVARGAREPGVEERVVEAEAAGPDQHGALEQRRRDGGGRGGGGEGGRGGAPRRGRAREGGEERGPRRRERVEGEGAGRRGDDGGGWGVEEVGEHGDWRYAQLVYQSLESVRCVTVLPFLSVDTAMLVWDLGEGEKRTKEKKRKEEKDLDLSSFVLKDFLVEILADP